MRYEVLNGHEV